MNDGTLSKPDSGDMPKVTTTGGRFKPSPNEKVLMAAAMFFAEGEVHASDLRPGSYRAQESKIFLTFTRLVATRMPPLYLFGPSSGWDSCWPAG